MNKTNIAIAAVEVVALAVGLLLCYFGVVAWYIVPFFLLVPPAIVVVAVIASFAATARNGGNPFQ